MSEDAPSVWELNRILGDVKADIRDIRLRMTTTESQGQYAANLSDKLRDIQGQIDRLDAVIEDIRKTRAAQWFGIGLGILSAVTGIVVTLISHALQ